MLGAEVGVVAGQTPVSLAERARGAERVVVGAGPVEARPLESCPRQQPHTRRDSPRSRGGKHALGLGHSALNGATMFPSVSSCNSGNRTLDADIAGVRALYPLQAPPPPPTAVRIVS